MHDRETLERTLAKRKFDLELAQYIDDTARMRKEENWNREQIRWLEGELAKLDENERANG